MAENYLFKLQQNKNTGLFIMVAGYIDEQIGTGLVPTILIDWVE